ncbi:autotransporter assembly complex protein TamA [Aliagarivorans taiwanensis]|uniref:autotransporter assembly complex protein TamA n=1 Tax=Aliagarivorans taiwanensis TaxID=561966 RepID=UPI0004191EB9|nr:autotransporter assembly complex family protein [Aliagarivorans taiwanensis]
MSLRALLFITLLYSCQALALEYRLVGIDGAAADNVNLYLNNQSFSDSVGQRFIESASIEQTRTALRALGYYQSTINTRWEGDSRLVIEVDIGPPLTISELRLEIRGDALLDPVYLQVFANTSIKQGGRFNHGAFEALKSDLNRIAVRYGYFDANLVESRVTVSIAENSAEIDFIYDSGLRYRFGELIFTNPQVPGELFVDLAGFERGQYYDAEVIGEFNQKLGETDYFRVVAVQPDLETRRDQHIDMLVELRRKPRDTFEIGGGVATDVGPRLRFKWNRPWVNAAGHSVGFEADGSQVRQSGSLFYRIPMNDPIDDYLDFQSGWEREDTNDTVSNKLVFSSTRQWRVNPDLTTALFLRWLLEDYEQADQNDRSNLILPGVNLARLRSRGGLDPYWGDNLQLSTELSSTAWGSDVDLLRVTGLTKWLRSYRKHRLITRVNAGAIWVDDITDVPASMRFFAGGDQSIRGYDYKTISPTNDEGQLIGGKFTVVGSLEYNYQIFDRWRVALFADAGTATNDFSEEPSVGLGFGIRWVTIIGPVRLDIAKGLQNDDDPWRLHFSMGPDI